MTYRPNLLVNCHGKMLMDFVKDASEKNLYMGRTNVETICLFNALYNQVVMDNTKSEKQYNGAMEARDEAIEYILEWPNSFLEVLAQIEEIADNFKNWEGD